MKLSIVALVLGMAMAGAASAEQSDKLFVQGELFKDGASVLHFADAAKSGSDTTISTLIEGSYLNEMDPDAQIIKLVPWKFYTGALLTLNPMLAGDGSILLSLRGFDSSVSEFKGTKKNPGLQIPKVVVTEIKSRQILDEGQPTELHFGHCKDAGKNPTDCDYLLRVTVSKR